MSRRTIDLNADLGEGCAWDGALLSRISSANVSCGAHAGTPEEIRATLRRAVERRVIVGAHPGYADREGFGRREQDRTAAEVEALVVEQVGALRSLAAEVGAVVRYLKPHGALYNQAQRQVAHAEGVTAAASRVGLPLLGQPGSMLEGLARTASVRFVAEGFADRGYRTDGRLIPRGEPGATLEDPEAVAVQVLSLVDRGFATVCLHGDDPRAAGLADLVRTTLARAGVRVGAFLDADS